MTRPTDLRRLRLKTTVEGNWVISRLVFEGTDLEVGDQVYRLHDRLSATGYMVQVKVDLLREAAALGYPMYGTVVDVTDDAVTVEEAMVTGKDPSKAHRREDFSREVFLKFYEVD